jgi:5-methylcytosine-specific restriction endonuclease McrA
MAAIVAPLIPVVLVWVGRLLSGLRPVHVALTGEGWLRTAEAAFWLAVDLRWVITGICVPIAVYGLVRVFEAAQRVQKDPTRMFTASQRAEGFARAGNTCELEAIPFVRCTRTASHGDHFFPWSLGGASTMANFVAACRKCNLTKSNKYPSPLLRARIERRRKKYFPAGVPVTAGDRMHLKR